MKKMFIAAAAIVAAVAFTACGNKAAEATEEATDTIAAAVEEVGEVVEAVDTVSGDTIVVAEVETAVAE